MVNVKIVGTQAENLTRDLLVHYKHKVQADLREMDQKSNLNEMEDKYYLECLQFCNATNFILGYLKIKD